MEHRLSKHGWRTGFAIAPALNLATSVGIVLYEALRQVAGAW